MDTNIIAFDSHKRYTQICIETQEGNRIYENRLNHERGAIRKFLEPLPDGSPIAIETIGNWYWIVDEIESAQMEPRLVDARKAKMMLCCSNKTDKLDARGLNKLQRAGTLPIVWIPPGDLRDKRELPRTRMVFARQRTKFKNRIHSVIDKYGLQDLFGDIRDIFGKEGRTIIDKCFLSIHHGRCNVYSRSLTTLKARHNRLKAGCEKFLTKPTRSN